jgi:HSP20 family protein
MATLTVPKEEKKEMKPALAPRGEFGRDFFSNQFGLMRGFSDEMDRLFQNFGFKPRFFEATLAEPLWSPDIEVFEEDNRFVVRADLPGLVKDDVKVNIVDDVLTLEGERKDERETKGEGYYRSERNYGAFYRSIPLPGEVKTDAVEAIFKNGVLEIAMPLLKPEKKTKKVDVKVL